MKTQTTTTAATAKMTKAAADRAAATKLVNDRKKDAKNAEKVGGKLAKRIAEREQEVAPETISSEEIHATVTESFIADRVAAAQQEVQQAEEAMAEPVTEPATDKKPTLEDFIAKAKAEFEAMEAKAKKSADVKRVKAEIDALYPKIVGYVRNVRHSCKSLPMVGTATVKVVADEEVFSRTCKYASNSKYIKGEDFRMFGEDGNCWAYTTENGSFTLLIHRSEA